MSAIDVCLIKSQEDLQAAELLMRAGLYRPAVIRAYYGVFHAMGASMRSIGKMYAKHSVVLTQFEKEFIRTGKVAFAYKDIKRIMDGRRVVNYDDAHVCDAKETFELLCLANRLVLSIRKYLSGVNFVK